MHGVASQSLGFFPRFARNQRCARSLSSMSVRWRCRVRQLSSQASFNGRGCSDKVRHPLVFSHSAVPARAAQPFNQPDVPQQAGSRRLSQTLGPMKYRLSRGLVVLAGFLAVMGMGLLVGYLRGFWPTPEQECKRICQAKSKQGVMVPVYPGSMTGARGGPVECECR